MQTQVSKYMFRPTSIIIKGVEAKSTINTN